MITWQNLIAELDVMTMRDLVPFKRDLNKYFVNYLFTGRFNLVLGNGILAIDNFNGVRVFWYTLYKVRQKIAGQNFFAVGNL